MHLTEKLPEIHRNFATKLLLEYWGIWADVDFLTSERDQNIIVISDDHKKYLLKISHPDEPEAVSNLQTSGLLHISRKDPSLPVPQVIPTTTGEYEPLVTLPDGRTSMVRLFSFLRGKPIGLTNLSKEISIQLGSTAARLDMALADLHHPNGQHELLWDTSKLEQLASFLGSINDKEKRHVTEKYMALLCDNVLPRLKKLPAQLIHNDLNLGNILFENKQVTGIVDFGDMIHTQRVIDPANLCSYLALDSKDPFSISRRAAKQYITENPLTEDEQDLLPFLVVGRSLVTILITNWRASLMPHQAVRILRHEHMAYKVLQRIEANQTSLSNLFWGK